MNSRFAPVLAGLLFGVIAAAPVAAKPLSDLVSTDRRRVIVEQAQRLMRPADPAALPVELAQPFNPPNFEQPDPEELRAAAALAARNNPAPAPGSGGSGAAGAGLPVRQPPDREILENLAAKLPATGTIIKPNGEPLLIFGRRNMAIGSQFTVADAGTGQEYDLELVAIDRTTFTLRYRNEEITRPIKSGKSK